MAELAAEVSERLSQARSLGTAQLSDAKPASPELGPKVLVVLDGARVLRRIPGMPQVLAAALQAGVYSICIDQSERLLPEECATVVSWDAAKPATSPCGATSSNRCWRTRSVGLAERMAPARWPRCGTSAAMTPTPRSRPRPGCFRADRRAIPIRAPSPPAGTGEGATTTVPIGTGADGPYDRPAGRWGPVSCKHHRRRKVRATADIIASLAVANRPDSMTFVLIDCKTAARSDCARLPHTVGMAVT